MSDFVSGFIPGRELSRAFYTQMVRPLIGKVPHGAALIGPGSEVLAFDTQRSADHDFGPRVLIFTEPARVPALTELLDGRLPERFRGYPTTYGTAHRAVRHGVQVTDLGTWAAERLGFDPRREITTTDWLSAPWQRLAEATSGEVFHDGLGELAAARDNLRWYPPQVWRYVLACQWRRVAQLEGFPGRCEEVGDHLGSIVVTARLIEDLMRLCLLMRRRYPPYAKWLGSAFARLAGSAELGERFTAALTAPTWRERQGNLCAAYRGVAALHNRLRLTTPLDETVRPYHDRPFMVLDANRFTEALLTTVPSPLRDTPLTGTVDQLCDNTDILTDTHHAAQVSRASQTR